jgi:hypothetical protein
LRSRRPRDNERDAILVVQEQLEEGKALLCDLGVELAFLVIGLRGTPFALRAARMGFAAMLR